MLNENKLDENMTDKFKKTESHNPSESELSDLLCVGDKCNWINQPERLIYLGNNFSANGYWHQFAKVECPDVIWCEVITSDLKLMEKTLDT